MRLKGGILGRADDMVTIRGNNVFPSSVEAVIREFNEIAEFRIEVRTERSMNHLSIEVEPESSVSETEHASLIQRLGMSIKDRLNFTAEISMAAEPLPRFEQKGRRFFRIESAGNQVDDV